VQKLYQEIMAAAPSDAAILITGENGTGKEMVARTIHQFSRRPEEPFIIINCAAIPEETLDSELFGHEKGALGHAASKNMGKFELAAGGTLFLDEIGDMNVNTQAKILRALESKTFQRIGSSRVIHMDARIIASTNKDLTAEIEKGRFRQDLYFRLNVIPIHVPPLRKRKQDIPMLVDTFLTKLAEQSAAPKKTMSKAALDLLAGYAWPGNVRELKNLVERLSIMVQDNHIDIFHLPHPYHSQDRTGSSAIPGELFDIDNLEQARSAFEKEYVRRKVAQAEGDITLAAKTLGTSTRYIKKKLD
jgi:two-component system nitrogen regulation response regulator NtrX